MVTLGLRWRTELKYLSKKLINRYYFPIDATIRELQLHRICDSSENAFAGVVYIRMTTSEDKVHTSLVLAKKGCSYQEVDDPTFRTLWSIPPYKNFPSCERSTKDIILKSVRLD